MTLLHRLTSIVRWIARRERAEQDLNDELQAFIDIAADAVLIRPFPYTDADRLVMIWDALGETDASGGKGNPTPAEWIEPQAAGCAENRLASTAAMLQRFVSQLLL